jgi:hypothetical protein
VEPRKEEEEEEEEGIICSVPNKTLISHSSPLSRCQLPHLLLTPKSYVLAIHMDT